MKKNGKYLKRILSFFTILAMTFMVFGCKADEEKETGKATEKESTGQLADNSDVKIRVGSLKGPTSIGLVSLMNEAEKGNTDIKYDDFVDITDKVCPLTFVKAKVAIDELDDGEVLAVRMNDGEPVQNVPRSFKEDGHQVLKLYDNEDGTFTLLVRKVEE